MGFVPAIPLRPTISGGMVMARGNRHRYLLIVVLVLQIGGACVFGAAATEAVKPGPLVIDADEQFAIATQAFERGENFRAVVEYERFVFYFPKEARVPGAMLQVGLAHHRGGSYREAIGAYYALIDRHGGTPEAWQAFFRIGECHVALGEHGQALAILAGLATVAPDRVIADEAHLRGGLIHAAQGEWDKARAAFENISPARRGTDRLEAIAADLNRAATLPRKDPALAGWLSIVPGAGFLYCERYRDAAVAFLLNIGLMAASYEAFSHGSPALGSVVGFVGAGFYAGNIYGAVSSAHKFNRRQDQGLLEQILNHARMEVSVKDEGLALGLRVDF